MEIHLPESVSNRLVPFILASNAKLNQSLSGDFNWRYRERLKGFLLDELIDLLGNSSWKKLQQTFNDIDKYNRVKKFNPIALVETKANIDYRDEETGFQLLKGDWYLGIHIQPRYGRKTDLPHIMMGCRRMAAYIDLFHDRLPSSMVVGITYEKLASVSKRFGFSICETPLPPQVVKRFINVSKDPPAFYDVSHPKVCFQTSDDFIRRFSF